MESQAEVYEQENVHEVYQNIAQHFSATRYKVWRSKPDATSATNGFPALAYCARISSKSTARVNWTGRRLWKWQKSNGE